VSRTGLHGREEHSLSFHGIVTRRINAAQRVSRGRKDPNTRSLSIHLPRRPVRAEREL